MATVRYMHKLSIFCQGKEVAGFLTCKFRVVVLLSLKTVWPSGLRRWLKAPFRKGVGSNPTAVTASKEPEWGAREAPLW